MAGGAYVALSGLRSRSDHLERLAADIANAGTSGYKAERGTTSAAERPTFDRMLESAIDVAPGPSQLDFQSGVVIPTGRDLDIALRGKGFFVIDTPGGPRYTRNGAFERRADGTLITSDGSVVSGRERTDQAGTRHDRHWTGRHGQGRGRGGWQAEDRGFLRLLASSAREGAARFRADNATPGRCDGHARRRRVSREVECLDRRPHCGADRSDAHLRSAAARGRLADERRGRTGHLGTRTPLTPSRAA